MITIFRILNIITLQVVIATAAPVDNGETPSNNQPIAKDQPKGDQPLATLAKECLAPLKSEGASKVAMTYLFHNGTKESAVSKYIKSQITTQLLREAGQNITLIDRQDFKIQQQEEGFGYTFSTGDGVLSNLEPVDAILVGELISSPQAGTIVICLKAIDLKTSRILSAPLANVKLNKDIATRLGISELDLPVLPPLPTPLVDPESWRKDLSAVFDPRQISCSLDDPGGSDAASSLNTRLLRAYFTSGIISGGWTLLEREMFFLVANDQVAAGNDLSSYPVGDVVLHLQIDDTAPKNQPTCFAKAVQRKGGRLLGQAQVALNTSVDKDDVGKHIGGDQALAEALGRTQGKLKPSKDDPLVFSASIILTDVLKTSKELTGFFERTTPHIFVFNGNPVKIVGDSGSDFSLFLVEEHKKSKIIEETLIGLNAVESENFEAIKADLLSLLLWGYALEYDDEQGTKRAFRHLGPLFDVARQICAHYSLSPEGKDTTNEWLSMFHSETMFAEGPHSTTFTDRLLQSLHPKHKAVLTDHGGIPLRFPVGSYKKDGYAEFPSFRFNYTIETVWKEVFPTAIKVTIDLTPMKNTIYKIKK
jgi:hypothetical protein